MSDEDWELKKQTVAHCSSKLLESNTSFFPTDSQSQYLYFSGQSGLFESLVIQTVTSDLDYICGGTEGGVKKTEKYLRATLGLFCSCEMCGAVVKSNGGMPCNVVTPTFPVTPGLLSFQNDSLPVSWFLQHNSISRGDCVNWSLNLQSKQQSPHKLGNTNIGGEVESW